MLLILDPQICLEKLPAWAQAAAGTPWPPLRPSWPPSSCPQIDQMGLVAAFQLYSLASFAAFLALAFFSSFLLCSYTASQFAMILL